MKKDILQIGSFAIHGYGLMIGIGFIVAIMVGTARAKKWKLNPDELVNLALVAIVCGFLGAKLLYIIVEFPRLLKNPLEVLGSSGFVVYGGIIAGVLSCMTYCKIKKLVFLDYFDLVIPEVAIAQGFGRIGCFLAGCCYGRETTLPIGVIFPADSMAPSGIPLIPTQLFSAVGDIGIALILMMLAKRFLYTAKKLLAGDIGYLYMMLYGIGRFLIEFLRNDDRGAVGTLSTSQFISVFIVVFGAALFAFNHKKNKI